MLSAFWPCHEICCVRSIRVSIDWAGDPLQNRDLLIETIGEKFVLSGKTLAIAESCTGGALSSALTEIPGSSRYFLGSFVVYSNLAKTRFLHISPELLERHGAVSSQVARHMADSVREALGSSIGISITGIAGPGGGAPGKPVGLVFIGICDDRSTEVKEFHFTGSRQEIRTSSTIQALLMVENRLNDYAL